MAPELIHQAFDRLGDRLTRDVEILIVGGSALLLTGLLPGRRTTDDVDLFACELPCDRDELLDLAADVGLELNLPAGWLNDFSGLFRWMLPDDWRSRAVVVGTYGRLRVVAPGRRDQILMKLLAHRDKDRVHLTLIDVTSDELAWAIERMQELPDQFPQERNGIEMAIAIAKNWKEQS